MINIYIKTLSGEIQTLEFPQDQQVTILLVKFRLNKKGYITHLMREKDEDSKEEEDTSSLPDNTILKDNDILCVFYTREEFTKEDTERFENKLKTRILFFKEFKESIIKNKAIIAGGSVLSTFSDYDINDIDIYVNYSNAKELLKDLYILGCSRMSAHKAPSYDQSFFRKNNIIARFFTVMNSEKFYDQYQDRYDRIYRRYRKILDVDVMIIPDHIPLENVVTNFDLTFCQVWWDGEKIHSYDIDDIKSKSGSLNPQYVESYLNVNTFIIDRILKYKKRGFTIKIDISGVGENVIKKDEKTINNNECWAVTKLLEYIWECSRIKESFLFEFLPQTMTLSSLYQLFGHEVTDAYIMNFYVDNVRYYPKKYSSLYKNLFSDILDRNSQQDSIIIIRDWCRQKRVEYAHNVAELKKLFKDFKETHQKEIIDSLPRNVHENYGRLLEQ